MARSAQAAGADGILLVTPYYSRPSQEGLYQHFAKVASETDLPVMLYDIPGRTGVAISDELMKRLAEIDNIVAVKDATGKVEVGRGASMKPVWLFIPAMTASTILGLPRALWG